MAYGGRAYDDEWWKEDGTETTSQSNTTAAPRNDSHFHSVSNDPFSSHSASRGVYSANPFGSAYDDDHGGYSGHSGAPSDCAPSDGLSGRHGPNNGRTAPSDPYEAILAKSKMLKKNKTPPSPHPARSRPKSQSNGSSRYRSDDRAGPPSTNPRRHKTVRTSKRDDFGNANPPKKGHAVHRSAARKYRSGRLHDEYSSSSRPKRAPRTRPDFQDTAQRMEYKERLRNSTKSKLDESLQTAFQTESVAADTSERLYHQRKQLENVDKMLHETDQNLDRTEHTLKGMKSLWGGIGNYFKRAPEKKPYRGRESNGRQRGNARNKGVALERERAERKSDGGHSAKVSIGGTPAEDEEFNDKLDELHQSVQRMRMMAENMNRELDDQNQLIGGIDDKMERVNGRIDKQNYTMKRIR